MCDRCLNVRRYKRSYDFLIDPIRHQFIHIRFFKIPTLFTSNYDWSPKWYEYQMRKVMQRQLVDSTFNWVTWWIHNLKSPPHYNFNSINTEHHLISPMPLKEINFIAVYSSKWNAVMFCIEISIIIANWNLVVLFQTNGRQSIFSQWRNKWFAFNTRLCLIEHIYCDGLLISGNNNNIHSWPPHWFPQIAK